MSHADRIARIMIQLDDWQPAIWRRAEVPLTATLKALHDVIQAAMPFDDYHLFEFRADGKRYAIPDPEWDSLRDRTYSAKTTRLGTLVDRGITQLAYTYDFGDDWRHTIMIEAIRRRRSRCRVSPLHRRRRPRATRRCRRHPRLRIVPRRDHRFQTRAASRTQTLARPPVRSRTCC